MLKVLHAIHYLIQHAKAEQLNQVGNLLFYYSGYMCWRMPGYYSLARENGFFIILITFLMPDTQILPMNSTYCMYMYIFASEATM